MGIDTLLSDRMTAIDLNADLGEGGAWDDQLFPLITSANIACGGHAGDAETLRRSIALAVEHNVSIGAHPGLVDREQFGRIWHDVPLAQLESAIYDQIVALKREAESQQTTVAYVKPHGALYNKAVVDTEVSQTVVRAIQRASPELLLYAAPGSIMAQIASEQGLRVAHETFADRAYHADGTLVSRSKPDSVLHDPQVIAERVLTMVQQQTVHSIEGETVHLTPQTICLHSDTHGAVDIARAIRDRLQQAGVQVRAVV